MIGLETPPVTTGLLPDSPHTAGHYHIARLLVSLGYQYYILTALISNPPPKTNDQNNLRDSSVSPSPSLYDISETVDFSKPKWEPH